MSPRAVLWLFLATLAVLIVPASTDADVFGTISLVSKGASEQAIYAHDPAISGNGEYVAFDGYLEGRVGVWRRDLQSGAVEAVAVGEPGTAEGSAELPSISENGRYISFTTTARLSAEDTNNAPDVYVRDMDVPASEPGAFTLASAVDGSTQGLSYKYGASTSFEETHYGSVASGRTALSANGEKVAFVTTAISNLANPEKIETPVMQVAVRDLVTHETQLVSVHYPVTGRPEPVSGEEGGISYGAVYSAGAPPAFAEPPAYGLAPPLGASISADGSTVAWMADNVDEQAQMLAKESVKPTYVEPLWRRIADGPMAPIRRITGGSDPADPLCVESGETALPGTPSSSDPCLGPFATTSLQKGIWAGGTGDVVPQLSQNGETVAFLADVPLVAQGDDFGLSGEDTSDLYVVNMQEGLTRDQALRPLTEISSSELSNRTTDAPIVDLGLSPSGQQVAFTTDRTVFTLGSPAFVSEPLGAAGLSELYDADLATDTLTRVTHGYEGGPSEHPHRSSLPGEDPYEVADGTLSPSFSDNGESLAFSSTASNLVYGDTNTPVGQSQGSFDGSDVFVVSRESFRPTETEDYVSSPPASPALVPPWRLNATALSRRDGSVLLYVELPGAGALHAGAQAPVRAQSVYYTRARGSAKRIRHTRTSVATRTVASGKHSASAGGLVTLALTLAGPYGKLASAGGGLSADVTLVFDAPGHPTLRQSIQVSFLRTAKTKSTRTVHKASRAKKSKSARGGRRK
jgi:hypothetical protein